ncbi:MAG: tetratricopeptide repeat protein [Rhodoferax sp.]|nr:tetratricopeptide repeat protein [Rhodoferax sp.]MCF8209072.1 tetratricopeptide repeat protein [Rhodoferax sp.]
MKHSPFPVLPALRLLALAASMTVAFAHADEYSEVSQLVRAGKLSEALNKVDQHLASKPRDPQMRFLKGVIQRDNGKTSDAIATFTRLTEDYPELPEPYNNLAVLYAGQSQFDKARTALEMAIRTNPSYATAHENLGDVYAKLASQAYTKALQLDTANQAVAPKLALIRELFSPGAKGQKPTQVASAAPDKPAPAAQAAPVTPDKSAPTLPGPAPVKAPVTSTTPASAPAATAPAAVPTTSPTVTPPAAKPPAPAMSDSAETREVESAVRAWASAWAAQDMKAYFAKYGKDFATPSGQTRAAWEEERRQRIGNKTNISVKLDNLKITVNGNKASATFRQDYKASGLAVTSRKTLDLAKKGEQWQILKESVGN